MLSCPYVLIKSNEIIFNSEAKEYKEFFFKFESDARMHRKEKEFFHKKISLWMNKRKRKEKKRNGLVVMVSQKNSSLKRKN